VTSGFEGFHQVVVGAGVEAADAVGHLVERGEDDDRRGDASRAQASQEGDPQTVGQHQIQQDEVVGHGRDRAVAGVQPLHPVHRVAVGRDLVAHGSAQDGVVFDQQDAHGVLPRGPPSIGPKLTPG
jgi:hypothetical protein